MDNPREIIVKRIARMFEDGDLINLGIGMPTMVANYLPKDKTIFLHSENGFTGLGPVPKDTVDKDVVNAGGQPVTILPGGACFDSATSFAIIRGGHLSTTVLGAFQVDEKGNLANWMVPGKLAGMGGAMDLVSGAKTVIIAMEHASKDGTPKILKQCNLPLTAVNEVDFIVTEMGLMEITKEGVVLRELADGVTVSDIQAKTEAQLIIPDKIGRMSEGGN